MTFAESDDLMYRLEKMYEEVIQGANKGNFASSLATFVEHYVKIMEHLKSNTENFASSYKTEFDHVEHTVIDMLNEKLDNSNSEEIVISREEAEEAIYILNIFGDKYHSLTNLL